jgi:acetyl-CoA decarbonylase/synthase complex subunit gamma
MEKSYIIGSIQTESGEIPQISTELTGKDRWGAFRVRCGINRMQYRVEPGLYAAGTPDKDSIVLVSANYKLSFDVLRSSIPNINAWIMVLETYGINVWCAAGEGTFGTEEIVSRIQQTGLENIVNHKNLIVPQLGATGVSAHEVKKQSGFKVVYGPVRATDIPGFIQADMNATSEMRKVTFPMRDRAVLIPIELRHWGKYIVLAAVVFFFAAGINRSGYSFKQGLSSGITAAVCLISGLAAGGALLPLFLPWFPGRSFSLKGVWPGLLIAGVYYFTFLPTMHWSEITAWMLLIPAISSFTGLNFTGASTYTSLSGVKKEMRIAVPLQIIAAVSGIAFWIISRFI